MPASRCLRRLKNSNPEWQNRRHDREGVGRIRRHRWRSDVGRLPEVVPTVFKFVAYDAHKILSCVWRAKHTLDSPRSLFLNARRKSVLRFVVETGDLPHIRG